MGTDYDEIARDYHKINELRDDRSVVMVPTARHYLGDLRKLNVLDLACGDGFFTRLIRAWGAGAVTGVDLSRQMVDLAIAEESKNPLGIEYLCGDASTFHLKQKFDLIFAAFLLHYATSKEQLSCMCQRIYEHLKPGGVFLSFNENPFHPLHEGIQYNVESRPLDSLGDGSRVQRVHFDKGVEGVSLIHYHYEPATYNSALKKAGFSQIEWLPFVADVQAAKSFAPGYWDTYTGDFSIRVLRCHA